MDSHSHHYLDQYSADPNSVDAGIFRNKDSQLHHVLSPDEQREEDLINKLTSHSMEISKKSPLQIMQFNVSKLVDETTGMHSLAKELKAMTEGTLDAPIASSIESLAGRAESAARSFAYSAGAKTLGVPPYSTVFSGLEISSTHELGKNREISHGERNLVPFFMDEPPPRSEVTEFSSKRPEEEDLSEFLDLEIPKSSNQKDNVEDELLNELIANHPNNLAKKHHKHR